MPLWNPSTDTRIATALGLAVLALYLANGRSAGGGDVVPATLASVALSRGDGPFLDRFAPLLLDSQGRLPGYAERSRGRAVSRYPVGPTLLAAPLVAPQVLALDALRPGWEHQGASTLLRCDRMAKNASAILSALAVVLSWSLLRALGLPRGPSLISALLAAFGSGYWPVASQALWQHGPAVFCLAASMRLLVDPAPSLTRMSLAGALSALLVACRPIDLVFSASLALWVLFRCPRPARWAFFVPAFLGACALASYNLYFFDTLTGGYARIEQMHPWAHGTRGTFTGSLLSGGLGTLLSPSHGLWIHWPWTALATAALLVPEVRTRLLQSGAGLLGWLSLAIIPNFALLATYSCWWGGHCFGPRFWIDAVPIFVVWLAFALDSTLTRRSPAWRIAFSAAAILSLSTQLAGFLCYPSTWYGFPSNADLDHARLWDWQDSELTRGLAEGIRPRQW